MQNPFDLNPEVMGLDHLLQRLNSHTNEFNTAFESTLEMTSESKAVAQTGAFIGVALLSSYDPVKLTMDLLLGRKDTEMIMTLIGSGFVFGLLAAKEGWFDPVEKESVDELAETAEAD
jgi:hypothetical protein